MGSVEAPAALRASQSLAGLLHYEPCHEPRPETTQHAEAGATPTRGRCDAAVALSVGEGCERVGLPAP